MLAQALGYPFIDLDQEIQTAAGQSIEQIFAGEGEPDFASARHRHLETACQRRQVWSPWAAVFASARQPPVGREHGNRAASGCAL